MERWLLPATCLVLKLHKNTQIHLRLIPIYVRAAWLGQAGLSWTSASCSFFSFWKKWCLHNSNLSSLSYLTTPRTHLHSDAAATLLVFLSRFCGWNDAFFRYGSTRLRVVSGNSVSSNEIISSMNLQRYYHRAQVIDYISWWAIDGYLEQLKCAWVPNATALHVPTYVFNAGQTQKQWWARAGWPTGHLPRTPVTGQWFSKLKPNLRLNQCHHGVWIHATEGSHW